MPARILCLSLLACFCLALGAGCGPATAIVTGEVRVDGELVEKGDITFSSAEAGQTDSLTMEIKGGRYEIRTTVGKKFVQISVPVIVARHKQEGLPDLEVTDESLPERYNAQTELTCDVLPGQNSKDWSVESKKSKP